MGKKVIPQRKRLAAVLASFSILLVGTVSLCESMSIDYYSVLNTLQKAIPACIVMGGLGWVMGMVLDKPKKSHKIGYNNLFLNDMKREFLDDNITENNESEEVPEQSDNAKDN